MSCNRVHHGDTPTKATTSNGSTTDNSTVSNSTHSNRIPSRGGEHNHRSSSSIHKSFEEVLVAPHNDPSDTATTDHTDPIDAALLVEEASFDCTFSPILSIVIFLYRIIQVIACKSILRPYLKPSKGHTEENKAHDDVYHEGNNNTLWEMLALEWWHCAQRGFSYHRHYPIDDAYINNYLISGFQQSTSITRKRNPSNSVSNSNVHNNNETTRVSFLQKLPSDVQFHMLNYLPVRDIMAFSTASKTTNECVHNPRIAFPFWNMLCLRDYSDVMTWNVTHARFQESMQRVYDIKQCVVEENSNNVDNIVSFVSQWHDAEGKGCKQSTSLLPNNTSANRISDLYFILSQTWLPYSLAKHNTTKSCIVAIHNSIYDITNFLPYHPGSIDTLLINSGSNATKWFEDVGHSKRARNMAERMCVLNQGRNRYNGCVTRIKEELKRQENKFTDIAIRRLELENVIGDVVHVVFDFVVGGWCAWYTTLTEEGGLESVLVYLEEEEEE